MYEPKKRFDEYWRWVVLLQEVKTELKKAILCNKLSDEAYRVLNTIREDPYYLFT